MPYADYHVIMIMIMITENTVTPIYSGIKNTNHTEQSVIII